MSRLIAILRATLTAGVVFLYLYVVGTPFVVHAWLTRRADWVYRVGVAGVRLGLWLAGVRIRVHGAENLPRQGPCVYMANHISYVDPPVLVAALPYRIAMMGKRQVFSIPVLGAAIRLADFVSVDRDNREAARASVEETLEKLQRGTSFLVFPEGTRSRDGQLQPFKHGVFVLALRAGVPIVPITLNGARDIMARGKWEIYPGEVQVTIHPPVVTRHRRLEERGQLAEEVRAIVASALPTELRGAHAEPVAADSESDLPL